jgi:hypothetical protein
MAQYLKMADRLRKITGLKFEKRNVRFDHDSSRVEFVEQLAAQRMIPTVENFRRRFPKLLTRELEGICREHGRPIEPLRYEESIFEILGAYYWEDQNRAVVYDLNCLLVVCKLDLDYESLKEIVAAHEIAHAVTHLGEYDSLAWNNYGQSDAGKREFFAQAYAWFYSKGNSSLEITMRRLSEMQPEPYRLWEHFLDGPPDEINGILRFEMLGSNRPAKIRRVFDDETPGRKVEYALLSDLISYKNRLLKDAEERKVVSRRLLTELKKETDLFKEVVFRDFPQHRISGLYDPENAKMGQYLSVMIQYDLENVIRGLEYLIREGDVRIVED